MNRKWQAQHGHVIRDFVSWINRCSESFVLKGGTALMLCYRLSRFSEDVDFDSTDPNVEGLVAGFCSLRGYDYRKAKDTETVKRFFIHYENDHKPLKVEISYRKKVILPEETIAIGEILVYTIDVLAAMKAAAYFGRDRIRDLYDLAYICNHFYSELSAPTLALIRSSLTSKGIDYFDYLVSTQVDELIDPNSLAEEFLTMYDKLGLLYTKDEQDMIVQSRPRAVYDDLEP